jgi:hypothetical protein
MAFTHKPFKYFNPKQQMRFELLMYDSLFNGTFFPTYAIKSAERPTLDNNPITVDYINTELIEAIKNLTLEKYGKKLQIQPQRKHLVIGIMRHIYFSYIMNKYETQIEVDLLNKQVLKRMIPSVLNELIAYMRYINDYNNIVPMELPKTDNRKTNNTGSFSRMFNF